MSSTLFNSWYRNLEVYFLSWYLLVVLLLGLLGSGFCLAFLILSRVFPINVRIWMICISVGNMAILLFDALRLEMKVFSNGKFDIRDQNLIWCRGHLFLSNYFFYWSGYMQTCMSLQRLYFIWYPLKARYVLRTRFVVAGLAIVSSLLVLPMLPYLLYWHIGSSGDCEPPFTKLYTVTTILDAVLWGSVPLVLMCVSTALIAVKISHFGDGAKCARDNPQTSHNSTDELEKSSHPQATPITTRRTAPTALASGQRHGGQRDSGHITRLLVTVNVFYMLTTFPLLTYLLALNFYFGGEVGTDRSRMPQELHKFIYYFLRSLCYINSAFTWLLYFLSGQVFRDQVYKMFPRLHRIAIWFGKRRPIATERRPPPTSTTRTSLVPLQILVNHDKEQQIPLKSKNATADGRV